MKRILVNSEEEWIFAREVLLEIKKQQKNKLKGYPRGDGIGYNVGLLLDKKNPITIEELGKY